MPRTKTTFAPGKSGNPAGRPRGSRNKSTLLLEKLMIDDGEGVVRSVVNLAKDGDVQAARLVLDRILPARKGRTVPFNLPVVETAADVLRALSATVQAMAKGELTPEEAAIVSGVLETARKAIETVEIEQRLAAVERSVDPR